MLSEVKYPHSSKYYSLVSWLQHPGVNLRQRYLRPEQLGLKINFLLGIFPLLAILIFGHNSMNPLRNTFFTLVRWFGDTLTISFYLPTFHLLLKEVWLKVCTANSRPGFHLVFGFPTQVSKSKKLLRERGIGFQRVIRSLGTSQSESNIT